MPRTERHLPSRGPKDSVYPKMMHTSAHIRDKCPNTWKRYRVNDMVPVGQDCQVVIRGSTYILILCVIPTK